MSRRVGRRASGTPLPGALMPDQSILDASLITAVTAAIPRGRWSTEATNCRQLDPWVNRY